MAKYWTRYSFEIDMISPDFGEIADGRGRVVNDHTLKIAHGAGYVTTLKGDFDINAKGNVKGGTIEKIVFEDDANYANAVSGIEISLKKFLKVADSSDLADDLSLLAKVMRGGDRIDGGSGDDRLNGFAGDDVITGNAGADVLTGGLGADIFVYQSIIDSSESDADTITDFSQAEGDKISLRELGFFDFDTEIRITHTASQTIVEVDTVGGGAFFPIFIRMDGVIALTEGDFLL